MDVKLAPKMAEQISKVDGGEYSSWASSEFPLLSEAKVGAGKLVLEPRGFALPHYSDSAKIGYVLQGNGGIVGFIFPNTHEEKVLSLKKGDIIPVPIGVISWWYNNSSRDSDLIIIFLGETSKAHIFGEFNYFFLMGARGTISGFSNEFVARAYNIDKEEAKKLAKSQTGVLIAKLEQGKIMPQPCKKYTDSLVYNIGGNIVSSEVDVKIGEFLTAAEFPFLGEVGLSASLEKLDAYAMSTPLYTADSACQVSYIFKGSGRIQIVGMKGELVLDAKLEAGHLFVVPKFFAVAKIADGEGMESFSIITSSRPVIENLGGRTSVWKALSPEVLQASLNVTPELVEHFVSKIN